MLQPKTLRADPSSFAWAFWLTWVLVATAGWFIGIALVGQLGVGILIGVGQWLVLRPYVRMAWAWVPATIVGWTLGVILVATVIPPDWVIVGGSVIGATTGIAQWLILRHWFPRSAWWILASSFGWAFGLNGVLGPSLVGAVVGAVTGVVMELFVRHSQPADGA